MSHQEATFTIAGISDLHIKASSSLQEYNTLIDNMSKDADVIAICGDITHRGTIEEAKLAAKVLRRSTKPVVAVLGNHDGFDDNAREVMRILEKEGGITIIEGKVVEIQKGERRIGFTGINGFSSGGKVERQIKSLTTNARRQAFFQETGKDFRRLQTAMGYMDTPTKVVLMHYSPIKETIARNGECGENDVPIFSSPRFERLLDDHEVAATIHGHFHDGRPKGYTSGNIPVYNVAFPMMKTMRPHQPYQLIQI